MAPRLLAPPSAERRFRKKPRNLRNEVSEFFPEIYPESLSEIFRAFLAGRKSSPLISPAFPIGDFKFQIEFQIEFHLHGPWTGSNYSRAAKRGGFKRGGFPIWTCPSFFVPFCRFWDFPDFSGISPICSGMVRGFSRFVPFLFLGLVRARTRNSPERSATQSGSFPKKVGNPPVWKPPGLASPKLPLNFSK